MLMFDIKHSLFLSLQQVCISKTTWWWRWWCIRCRHKRNYSRWCFQTQCQQCNRNQWKSSCSSQWQWDSLAWQIFWHRQLLEARLNKYIPDIVGANFWYPTEDPGQEGQRSGSCFPHILFIFSFYYFVYIYRDRYSIPLFRFFSYKQTNQPVVAPSARSSPDRRARFHQADSIG